MAEQTETATENQVYVWDRFVRTFHWSMVVLVTISFITEGEQRVLHVWVGYAITALLAARILWGLAGSRHARFSDFLYAPAKVVDYLGSMLSLRAPRYLGHSPAGGLMVAVLILSLCATVATGIAANLGVNVGGDARFMGGLHEDLANVTMVLIFIHLAGVIVTSLGHRENLPRAMLTGWKRR